MTDSRDVAYSSDSDQQARTEKIAALIDGRVSGEERQRLLDSLGASEDDLEVFLDAAGAVADLKVSGLIENDSPDSPATVLPITSAKSRRMWRGVGIAGIAAMAASVFFVARSSTDSFNGAGSASDLVTTLSDKSSLPATWNYSPWAARRGDAVAGDSSTYVRIGARFADLELVLAANDSSAGRLAGDLAELAASLPGGGVTEDLFRRLSNDPRSSNLISKARAAIAALQRQDLVALGSWLEAARIASARGDSQWFARTENAGVAERITRDDKISPALRNRVREILHDRSNLTATSLLLEQMLREL